MRHSFFAKKQSIIINATLNLQIGYLLLLGERIIAHPQREP